MTPHDMAHAFVANFINLMKGDAEVSSFQRVLEMKVGEGRCIHRQEAERCIVDNLFYCHFIVVDSG